MSAAHKTEKFGADITTLICRYPMQALFLGLGAGLSWHRFGGASRTRARVRCTIVRIGAAEPMPGNVRRATPPSSFC